MREVPFVSRAVSIKRSRRRLSRFFARAALACAVGPIAIVLVASVLSALGWHTLNGVALDAWLIGWMVGTPLSVVAALIAGVQRRLPASLVEGGEQGLVLGEGDDQRRIERRAIVGALHVAGRRHQAEISLDDGDVIHIELASVEHARALVAALGFEADARRTAVSLGDDHDALAAGCWGVVIGSLVTTLSTCGVFAAASSFREIHRVDGHILGVIFVVTSLLVARLLAPKRLVVGTDGVVIEGMFGKQFIPLASIVDVATESVGVVVTLRDGTAFRTLTLTSDTGERAFAVRARIAEAVERARHTGAGAISALVARGERPFAAWRDALRRLSAEVGYRGETVSAEALLRTAESADAPAEDRIGAAMAIGMGADAQAKQRLRVAVEGIANERVRVAMERAADGAEDEAAIEEAIVAEKKASRQVR